jgi:hypothetical protein
METNLSSWNTHCFIGRRLGLAHVSRLFGEFAPTAAALLSTIARPVSASPFTFQFSKFIGSPMKSPRGGFPSSVPRSTRPETTWIDGPIASLRRRTTLYRPRLRRRRMRSMRYAAGCTLRTGLSGRTRHPSRGTLAPLRVRLANCPIKQLALHNIGIEFNLRSVGDHLARRYLQARQQVWTLDDVEVLSKLIHVK